MTPPEWIALLEAEGIRLRAAGITYLEIDGDRLKVRLSSYQAPTGLIPADTETPPVVVAQGEMDPLDDPMTFGGRLPNLHPPGQSENADE